MTLRDPKKKSAAFSGRIFPRTSGEHRFHWNNDNFGQIFIDLDDINRCSSAETIARLMYVGVSRARFKVYLTGILS